MNFLYNEGMKDIELDFKWNKNLLGPFLFTGDNEEYYIAKLPR